MSYIIGILIVAAVAYVVIRHRGSADRDETEQGVDGGGGSGGGGISNFSGPRADGGPVSGGTTGSWLGLGTSRTWERNRTTIGTSEAVLTIEIRDVATSTVRATASITLRGIVSSSA